MLRGELTKRDANMTVFSSLKQFVIGGGLGRRLVTSSRPSQAPSRIGVRHGSGGGAGAGGHGRKMVVKPSEWHKRRFFDELHYQFVLVGTPFLAIIFFSNVFIGQATLTEIPEGYEPEHWEYYKHPIERAYARMFLHPEPVRYEILMSQFHQLIMKKEREEWERKCRELMSERQDYKAWYFMPANPETVEKAAGVWQDIAREEGKGAKGVGGRLFGMV